MKFYQLTVEVILAAVSGTILFTIFNFGNVTKVNAFDFILVDYLQEAKEPAPTGTFVGGLTIIKGDSHHTIQVPGCVNGDTTPYPIQKIRIHSHNVHGGHVEKIIIISQTEPLPDDTKLQLFTISDCISGGQLYHKYEAATTP